MDDATRKDYELPRPQAQRAASGDALTTGASNDIASEHPERRRPGSGAPSAIDRLRSRARSGQGSELACEVLDVIHPAWRKNMHDVKWFATLYEIVRFREANGFLPRYNGNLPGERRLYQWLNSRRKEARGVGLGAAKFARERRDLILDERLPGWNESRDEKWLAILEEIVRFREVHGFLPRYDGDLPGEKRLHHWLNNRRSDSGGYGPSAAKFARERRDLILDERLPGWRGNRRSRPPG